MEHPTTGTELSETGIQTCFGVITIKYIHTTYTMEHCAIFQLREHMLSSAVSSYGTELDTPVMDSWPTCMSCIGMSKLQTKTIEYWVEKQYYM